MAKDILNQDICGFEGSQYNVDGRRRCTTQQKPLHTLFCFLRDQYVWGAWNN